MPRPKDPNQPPRLRWSPEELDLLVREAAQYLLAAERDGQQLSRNRALALAQQVLPPNRQRQIDADYNPRWMTGDGRIEAVMEQLRTAPPTKPEATPAHKHKAASPPKPVPVPSPSSSQPAARAASRSTKAQPQVGLFPEPTTGISRRTKVPPAVAAPADVPELAPVAPAPASAFAPEPAPPAAEPVAVSERATAQTAPEPAPAPQPARTAESAAESVPPPAPAKAPAPAEAAPAAPARPAPPLPASVLAETATPVVADALATLGINVLAGAFRSVVAKALAGLLTEALRQPEVQAVLCEAVASAMPTRAETAERAQSAPTALPRPSTAARPPTGARRGERGTPAEAAPLPQPAATDFAPVAQPGADTLVSTREPEIDDEAPPSDPHAWQPTPLNALPQRTARGASEPPKPTVLVFGVLPRDQHKLRAEHGQKYNLRFGASDKSQAVSESVRKVDRIYSLVRFIPKDLDRSLAASGVPYSPLANVGELRQDLALNPPLPRAGME